MDALLLLKISHNGIFHCQHYRRCPPSFSNQEERNDTPFYDFIPGLNGKFFVALFFVYSAVNFEVALPLFQICKRTGLFPAFTLSWIYSVSGLSLIHISPRPRWLQTGNSGCFSEPRPTARRPSGPPVPYWK